MPKSLNDEFRTKDLVKVDYPLFDLVKKEKVFIIVILFLGLISFLAYPYPHIAMWIGFALAGYAAIANDSIQTIGTFIASNKDKKWYWLWLFMGSIFVITILHSWFLYNGDVSHQRLAAKGFDEAPQAFTFLELAAPIILLILTRMRMPVSTTFLLLSVFATKSSAIVGVLSKSMFGYFLAFFTAFFVWIFVSLYINKYFKNRTAGFGWTIGQWITSGLLWSVWIMQDAANIAIFLPRQLSVLQLLGFVGYIFIGLGLLFYLKGDKIQQIVDEKTGVTDVRAATLVDLIYSLLLYYKLFESEMPMSTTWLFIGLLGGRELAISITRKKPTKRKKATIRAFKILFKDMGFALIGLAVSVALTLAINTDIRLEVYDIIKNYFE